MFNGLCGVSCCFSVLVWGSLLVLMLGVSFGLMMGLVFVLGLICGSISF